MGLPRTTIQMLLKEAAVRPFSGSVATLGRQHVYLTWDEFQEFARNASVIIPPGITPRIHREPALAERGYAADGTIFAGLGFSECITIDYSDFEAVDEIFDLNSAETPSHLQNRFDLIVDTGTLEHVFHTPNVLANLHRMLKPGGRIVHHSPASNCLDHGFYSFSPTFFADYYHVNRYEIHQLNLCRDTRLGVNSPVQVFDYLHRGSHGFELGTLDDHVYFTWALVQRRDDSTFGVIPQQSSYVTQWDNSKLGIVSQTISSLEQEPVGTKAHRLLQMTSRLGPLHHLAKTLIQTWRRIANAYRRRFQFPLTKVGEYR